MKDLIGFSNKNDITLCDKVCQWIATGQWFSLGTLAASTNKTDRHDITEILMKVALNPIILTPINITSQYNAVSVDTYGPIIFDMWTVRLATHWHVS